MALSLAGVTYISSHLRQVSIPFFKHILKLCTLLLHMEGVGFVLRMRDASPSTNPSFKHDPCKALSVIRTILPAVSPIWLTRKLPPPLLFHPSCCGMWLWIGELYLLVLSPLQLVRPCQLQHKVCIVLAKKKREIENYKDSTLFN